MDNVTHILAGMVLAEAALLRQKSRIKSRGTAHFVSIAANNLPDLDFLYVGLTGGNLGYLLHHRGHTHTLLAAPVLSFAVLILCYLGLLVLRRDRQDLARPALWFLAFCGPLVHITMDYANSYGVHPFWPANNRWYYGDSVFIVEPLLWAATVPGLIALARTRTARALLSLVLAAGIALSWAVPMVPTGSALCVTLLALGMMGLVWKAARPARVVATSLAAAGVYGLFIAGATEAATVARKATAAFEGQVHDVAIAPMPANPICYRIMVVIAEGSDYVVKLGYISLLPAWQPAFACADGETLPRTAPVKSIPGPYDEQLALNAELRQPLAGLRELYTENCVAREFFRFARVPFRTTPESADQPPILGDLRYDRESGLGFAEIDVPRQPPCPSWVPPWIPPRQELLQTK